MATRFTDGTRRLFTTAALIAAVLVPSAAQQLDPAQFTSGVDLVPVDFLAVTSDGRPIADLKPGEVEIKIDGRARTIRSLQWVQVDATSAGSAPQTARLPAPFGSNTASEAGRGIIIVLEDESLLPGRETPLRNAMHRFLTSLAPRDRVALVTLPYGGLKVDFTREHDRVGQAFAQISGQASRGETGRDAACRTRRTLEALVGLLDGLSSPDAPTTVMFITGGLVGPRRDAPVTLAPGPCELTIDHFQAVGVAAAAACAHFYVVQPEDPSLSGALQTENIAGFGFTGSDNQMEGIEHLSGVTGARRLHLATHGDDTLLRIMRETAGYYLAAFEPERGDRNGAKHDVSVAVSRSDITLRTRPEMISPRVDPRGRDAAITPRAMLREARIHRDCRFVRLGMRPTTERGS